MPEYIERETLLKHAIALNNPHELGENVVPVSDVEAAPAADVAQVVRCGEWVRMDETQALLSVEWKCSQCGQEICIDGILTAIGAGWKYCPNCGAKMDKEDET